MENKKIRLAAFGAMALMLLIVPVMMIINRESVLRDGKDFKFRTQPVDPYDPFRGKYIVLSFNETMVPVPAGSIWQRGDQVFLEVREDSAGFAEVFNPSRERPVGVDHYFQAEVDYNSGSDNRIRVNFPFDRYYMEETKANPAERMYATSRRDTANEVYALVTVYQGEAILKDVMINDVPIKDLVRLEE